MHADRKKVTWQHLFKYVYTAEERWPLGELFDFSIEENLIKVSNGYQIKLKNNIEIDDNEKISKFLSECSGYEFRLSGDADFGMKYKFCEKHIENAYEKMHMFPNFSLIPVTGGMNNKKGHAGYNDRFDIFIYYLDKYYRNKDIKLLTWFGNIKEEYKIKYPQMLDAYMNLFVDAKDYCKKMYLIDDKMVEDLINNGINAIENKVNSEKNYCDLAIEYWRIRKNQMQNVIPIKEHWHLSEDMDNDKYQ